ncbi:3-carboxymuconate cyclase [Colletotrichum incanum]|uniref:3-carboxymuconate cyclase n=1 Tax=Colletotrichum incanum TaxID=1573173 RepID=A0A161Y3Z2_COLIC|nr:3-carboxymuconate cyclase [Colletotrichum incanum]
MPPVLTLLFLLVTSPVAVLARPARCNRTNGVGKGKYTITNDKVNAVVAVPISSNGMLSGRISISTGGAGSNFFDSTTNGPAAPDALASQSALTIAGTKLFVVNAGSNTMTMFAIDQSNPTKLTMSLGNFPIQSLRRKKNSLVCVGSSGTKSGISCINFSKNGVGAMDMLRSVDLNRITPPSGPTNTIPQAFFSNDESTLLATLNGVPDLKKTEFPVAYQVESGWKSTSVSQRGVRSSPNGTAVLFGSFTIPNTNDIFTTNASFGGAILPLDGQTTVSSLKGMAAVGGQKATSTNTAFVTDVRTNKLVEISLTDASIKSTLDLSANGDPGLTDLKAAGKFVYALSPGNGTRQPAITVVDTVGKSISNLKSLGLERMLKGWFYHSKATWLV